MQDIRFVSFKTCDNYPLFNYCIQEYKKSLLEKVLNASDEKLAWEGLQSIKTLERFQQVIESSTNNKQEDDSSLDN